MRRREFLRSVAASGVAAGLWPLAEEAAAARAGTPGRRVRLGRTELQISDIGFGSFVLDGDERVVHHALDRGINYFDTAESYGRGAAEETLGRALQGRRHEVLLTTKFVAEADHSADRIMRALEGSLRRLRTDHVDVFLNHAVNDLERLRNDAWGECVERARQQGKIRFSGMSGHGPRLVECLDYANRHDLVDVVLVAYNYAQKPGFVYRMKSRIQRILPDFDLVAETQELHASLARLKQRDVGVVCMKTLRGARLNDMRPFETGGATFAQAAFRWVLSDPSVDALVVTMKSPEAIDEYLGASGQRRPRTGDAELLERYEARAAREQCRSACEQCADACPHGVAIPDVLRVRMYAEDYGDRKVAQDELARLGRDASPCLTCTGSPCLDACPHGLPIGDLTRRAQRLLG